MKLIAGAKLGIRGRLPWTFITGRDAGGCMAETGSAGAPIPIRASQRAAMYAASFQCAGCFEWVETTVDESGGSRQEYVEDCQVCCKPNVLTIRWDSADQQYTISAELES